MNGKYIFFLMSLFHLYVSSIRKKKPRDWEEIGYSAFPIFSFYIAAGHNSLVTWS